MVNKGMTFEIYCGEKFHQKYEDKSRNVKLPKLDTKTFSGEPTAWMTFVDITYYHLWKKDALRIISGVLKANANYKKALE